MENQNQNPIPAEFLDVFRDLVVALQPRTPTTRETARVYFETLKQFPLEAIRDSARQLRRTCTFFPSTGEWFAAAQILGIEGRSNRTPTLAAVTPLTVTSVGQPNADGEWPYDPTEAFTVDDIEVAASWRGDTCPHAPPCPTVQVCVEEVAWYLRHRRELHELGV